MALQTYKVQVDASGTSLMVYNKDRSETFVGPKPDTIDMPILSKRYAIGYLGSDGKINIEYFLPEDHVEDW